MKFGKETDDFWVDANQLKPSDAEFTALRNEGDIRLSNFGKDPKSKYVSIVSDTDKEFVLEENKRFKYVATYISDKNQITGVKIQIYTKKESQLISGNSITLPFKQSGVLIDFLKFLSAANFSTLTSGKFVLADSLNLDPELYSKLITLSKDAGGKDILLKLFDSGYLTTGFDIPELIKRGLSQSKLNEKNEAINEFEKLIENPSVKEVTDIQTYLSKIPWIFGPEYSSLDVRTAGDSGIPDRRLKRIDGLSDILEIKLPNVELLRKDKMGRHFISPDLAQAIGQLTGYLEYYYSTYTTERDDYTGKEVLEDRYGKYYKPKGILLIGRRKTRNGVGVKETDDAHPKYLRRVLSYYHWVEVLTYDDLIERARNGLTKLVAE